MLGYIPDLFAEVVDIVHDKDNAPGWLGWFGCLVYCLFRCLLSSHGSTPTLSITSYPKTYRPPTHGKKAIA